MNCTLTCPMIRQFWLYCFNTDLLICSLLNMETCLIRMKPSIVTYILGKNTCLKYTCFAPMLIADNLGVYRLVEQCFNREFNLGVIYFLLSSLCNSFCFHSQLNWDSFNLPLIMLICLIVGTFSFYFQKVYIKL